MTKTNELQNNMFKKCIAAKDFSEQYQFKDVKTSGSTKKSKGFEKSL